MDSTTRALLERSQALKSGDGLKRVASLARLLGLVGLVLCIIAVLGVINACHPVVIAAAAAVMGWVVAETNALRSRLGSWPVLMRYIDWPRVEADLDHANER